MRKEEHLSAPRAHYEEDEFRSLRYPAMIAEPAAEAWGNSFVSDFDVLFSLVNFCEGILLILLLLRFLFERKVRKMTAANSLRLYTQ